MQLLDFIESIEYRRTDKYDLGYIHEFYNDLFTPRKTSCRNLLEIGIYHGHSIQLWRDYFNNAEITGVDIQYHSELNDLRRINLIYQDAYTTEFIKQLPQKHYDIIIDDGPHTFDTQLFFSRYYESLLRPGGIMILEDIIDITYTEFFLHEVNKWGNGHVVHMAGKSRTQELKTQWQFGLDVIVVKKNEI